MVTAGPYAVADGYTEFTGGVDSGSAPSVLAPNQCVWAINASRRNGFWQARPGWIKRSLTFASNTIRDWFEDGRFQGASYYQTDQGDGEIIASIHGQFYKIDENFDVTHITPYGYNGDPAAMDRNDETNEQAWFCQAEKWLLIQDGQAPCFIYDGSALRRAGSFGDVEVPGGYMMEYALGRVWVITGNRKTVRAGDLLYTSSGTPAEGYRDSILKFTEETYIAEGGAFWIPTTGGRINAIKTIGMQDTSLGHGPVMVHTDNTIYTINVPFDRTLWQDVAQPLQTSSPVFGSVSQAAVVQVNGDQWYRAVDGVRNLMIARRDFGTWTNTPLSNELDRVLPHDHERLLEFASGTLWKNWYLSTCSPVRSERHGIYHQGLAVLDFNSISRMAQRGMPVWEGVWTGPKILQVITGKWDGEVRCFAFILSDTDNDIELWELDEETLKDKGNQRIDWSFETRALQFQTPMELKELQYCDMWVDKVVGEVDFTLAFKPDQHPNWVTHTNWDICQDEDSHCPPDAGAGCAVPQMALLQYRPRMRSPMVTDSCDSVTGKPYRDGYEFQFRVDVTGRCRILKFRAWANRKQEDAVGDCLTTGATCQVLEACSGPNDFNYSMNT